ncbi:MAG: hypothetical protein PF440_07755 [Thiomicrorhabdus sp.]|nr:hypothetical protein [Thiomicrorhabdus sp.]
MNNSTALSIITIFISIDLLLAETVAREDALIICLIVSAVGVAITRAIEGLK